MNKREKKSLAIIGIQGIPNKYGGFETLVEFLTKYLSNDFNITVFCSSKAYKNRIKKYNNATLKYLPINANGGESIIYDSLSLLLSLSFDKILILGSSGGLIMPLLKIWKFKFILNIGGIDWKRSKWSLFEQKIIKSLESMAVRSAGTIISDNEGISNYILKEYGEKSCLIEYGGDQVRNIPPSQNDFEMYSFLRENYAFSVARIQKDNNVETILSSFAFTPNIPLVFVGNWNKSEYGNNLFIKYKDYPHIHLLDAIYDPQRLDMLRSNCFIYIHGHSAGGTNPSLVEAMNLKLPIVAFDSDFNRYTTENKAIYFKTEYSLNKILKSSSELELDKISTKLAEVAERRYKWRIIAERYKRLIMN